MKNFSFSNPVKILFGQGSIAKLSREIPEGLKILLVYGGGSIRRNGVYDQVMKALEGRETVEFAGIGANPEYETCLDAVALVREQGIGFILAVGGGSVIDAAKFIALGSRAEGDLWDIFAKARHPKEALPLGTVLTLPATGTEMNDRAVLTRVATQDKRSFRTPLVYPRFSVLDPTVTYSLPAKQIANGVVDAFVHTTEQYLTYPVPGALQDLMAESILKVLVQQGPKALEQPTDYDVRADLMWSSSWALNGWMAQGMPEDWATHMIGHELTAFFGMDHAETLAVVLPGLLNVLREDKADKILQMGERVFGIVEGTREERIQAGIDALDGFFRRMGIRTRLGQYGLGTDDVERVVQRVAERGWTLGEHANVTPQVVREILTQRL